MRREGGVVAFAFGVPGDIAANEHIAEMATNLGYPIFTQNDIWVDSSSMLSVTYIKEELGNPPPTLRIAREAVWWAKQAEIEELWVVAAAPHRWRCIRDLKHAIREANVCIWVRVHPGYGDDNELWFSPESTQERVRSFWKWWPREMVLRLMPMFIYKRVAG